MRKVYGEIENTEYNGEMKWRSGIVIEHNNLWACPGLDFWMDTREAAVKLSLEMAEDYAAECNDQGDEAEFCGLKEF
jgi:hypothetical protein